VKRLSSKPTVYLVDGSNFSMRFGGAAAEHDFVDWLASLARTEALRASCFRVVFDGPCRRKAPAGPSVIVYYSDSEPADELLLERGLFMLSEGVRALIITSDNGLRDRASGEGVKTMTCETFRALAEAELRKGER